MVSKRMLAELVEEITSWAHDHDLTREQIVDLTQRFGQCR